MTAETIAEWIERTGAARTGAKRRKDNPNAVGFLAGSYHWTVTMRSGAGAKMAVPFTKGPGLGPDTPELADVLGCLVSDARPIVDGATFGDWAGDFGFDTDSRRAERIYTACQRQTAELRTWAGPDFDSLMQTEEA